MHFVFLSVLSHFLVSPFSVIVFSSLHSFSHLVWNLGSVFQFFEELPLGKQCVLCTYQKYNVNKSHHFYLSQCSEDILTLSFSDLDINFYYVFQFLLHFFFVYLRGGERGVSWRRETEKDQSHPVINFPDVYNRQS